MVRNEAARYLTSALKAFSEFADVIVALDDGSTDATPDILRACPKVTYARWEGPEAWGAEAAPRAALFALARAAKTDWIFVLDADMVPARDPAPLFDISADVTAFRLYDLWSPTRYREDLFWQAHKSYRIWAVRNPIGDFVAEWGPARGIHNGHFPSNLPITRMLLPPQDFAILHYGYADPKDREIKAANYQRVSNQLTPHEEMHANSILDPDPVTFPLPFEPKWPLKHA